MEMTVTRVESPPTSPDLVERKINFVRPIIGFPDDDRYVLRGMPPRFAPYLSLESDRDNGPQFIVVSPGLLFADYVIEIPETDAELLGLESAYDVEVLALVTRRAGLVPTVNLLGPIVINWTDGLGAQLVLGESGFSVAVPVDAASAHVA